MKLQSPDKQFSVDLCERCTANGLPSNPDLYKLQVHAECSFCSRQICNDCNVKIRYEYGSPCCRVCLNYLGKTTGADLKALGFSKAKYDCITDRESIQDAVTEIHKKYAEKGREAVKEFLSALYKEAQDRYARREKADKEAARIRELKRDLTILEQEKAKKEKEILMKTPEELPF